MPKGIYHRDAGLLERLAKSASHIHEKARAAGKRIGRPSTSREATATCRHCKVRFHYKKQVSAKRRTACSKACARAIACASRSEQPRDFESMYQLYWVEGLSTIAIGQRFGITHKSVHTRMRRLGVPRRKKGCHSQAVCIIDGCEQPTFKIIHSNNGSPYGRRCLLHWVAHRQRLAHEWWFAIKRWRKRGMTSGSGDDVAARIDRIVPKELPPDLRADVCQELALRLLLGSISFDQLAASVKNVMKELNRNKWRELSLDAPIGGDDYGTLTFADTIVNDRVHF